MPNTAAKFKDGAHRLFSSHSHDTSTKSESLNPEQREREKQFISDYLDGQDSNAPKPEQDRKPRLKIGCSVQQLAIKDFKLLKTLGTG